MRKMMAIGVFLGAFFFGCTTVFAVSSSTAEIIIFPEKIIQGEPFMATIKGLSGASLVRSVTFAGKKQNIIVYKGMSRTLVAIDLNKKAGSYVLSAVLRDGTKIEKTVIVEERKKIEEPFSIPAKLGGNTVASQKKLVTTLSSENDILAGLKTGSKSFWLEPFRYPLDTIFITDEYGYSRKTGEYSIAHKGVDFRAKVGTPVYAMNRGVARIVKDFRNYGKTVVVDHGLGVMTFYMHLSKIYVQEGQLVLSGQRIAASGQTGYAESPHLHTTVRIDGISIDPIKFIALFK